MSPDTHSDVVTEAMLREVFSTYQFSPDADLAGRAVRQAARRRAAMVSTTMVATVAVLGTAAVLADGHGTSSVPPASSSPPVPNVSSSLTPSPSVSPTPNVSRPPARSVRVGDRVPIPGTGVVIVVGEDGFCTDAEPRPTAAERESLPGGCWYASDDNHGLGTANTTVGSRFEWGDQQLALGLAVDAVESTDVIVEGVVHPGVVLAPAGKDWRIIYVLMPWKPADSNQDQVGGGLLVDQVFDAQGNLLGPRPGQIAAGPEAIPSGLRGVPNASPGCSTTPAVSDPELQLITGRIQSIVICKASNDGDFIRPPRVLTPEDGSTFIQLAQALAEPDPQPSTHYRVCPDPSPPTWTIAVRTTDGTWLAHIPADSCGVYSMTVRTFMQRIAP